MITSDFIKELTGLRQAAIKAAVDNRFYQEAIDLNGAYIFLSGLAEKNIPLSEISSMYEDMLLTIKKIKDYERKAS